MAITSVGNRGTGLSSANNQSSLTLAVNGNVAVGRSLIVLVAVDNLTTANGEVTTGTARTSGVTDAAGNTYTLAKGWSQGTVAAGGAEITIWVTTATTQLNSGQNITATFSATVGASAMTAWEFQLAASNYLAVAASAGSVSTANIPSLTATTSNETLLRVRGSASEHLSASNWTGTGSFTQFVNTVSGGGTSATEMAVRGEWQIVTGTSVASAPTLAGTYDSAHAYAAFKETLLPITGTGPLSQVQPADADGVGTSSSEGIGTPAAQAADVDGTGTVTSAGGDWVEVYSTADLTGLSPGWSGYTHVGVVPLSAFSATGGSQIRLTFWQPYAGEASEYSAIWVGNGGGSDPYDFSDTPVRITADGGDTTILLPVASLPLRAAPFVTDAIPFVKDGTNSLVIAAQLENGSADNACYNAPGTGFGWYWKGSLEAATADKSGYTDQSSTGVVPAIAKIELFIGAPSEIEGDGALAAQTAAVAGSGETVATGTAGLIAATATTSGAAVSSSDGTGTLPAQSAAASGAAVSSSDGTGFVNAQAAIVAGAGTAAAANSGVLQAQAAAVAGAGAAVATGTGSLAAAPADADGIGISGSYGLGSPSAQASEVAGAGVSSSTGTGSLVSQPSTVAGAHVVGPATGTGTLAVVAAAVAGVGDSSSSGTGAANDNDAAVAGLGQVLWAGTGVLVAQSAAVFGSLGLIASGELAASSAAITGVGEAFVTPTLAGQRIVLAADVRHIELAADSRTITAIADSRTITLNAENRMIVVPAEDRILEAA